MRTRVVSQSSWLYRVINQGNKLPGGLARQNKIRYSMGGRTSACCCPAGHGYTKRKINNCWQRGQLQSNTQGRSTPRPAARMGTLSVRQVEARGRGCKGGIALACHSGGAEQQQQVPGGAQQQQQAGQPQHCRVLLAEQRVQPAVEARQRGGCRRRRRRRMRRRRTGRWRVAAWQLPGAAAAAAGGGRGGLRMRRRLSAQLRVAAALQGGRHPAGQQQLPAASYQLQEAHQRDALCRRGAAGVPAVGAQWDTR